MYRKKANIKEPIKEKNIDIKTLENKLNILEDKLDFIINRLNISN